MRESWTDDRLDDLSHRVDELSRRVDDLGRRVDDGFNAMRGEMNARFERREIRFDSLQRMMIQLWAGTMFTLLAGIATLLATQL